MRLPLAASTPGAGLVLAVLALLGADVPPRPRAPALIASAADGTIVFAELGRPGIFRLDAQGRVEVVAAGDPRHRTPLHAVSALAAGRDGTIYAADRATAEVYRIETGTPPAPMTGGVLEVPTGLDVTSEGDLIVCDLRLGLVAFVPKQGGALRTLARVPAPRAVVVEPSGAVVVLSLGPDQLVRVSPDGAVKPIVTGKPFRMPIALGRLPDQAGWLVSDSYAATIWAVSDTGQVQPRARGAPLVRPEGLARGPAGTLLVADPGAFQVFRISGPNALQPLLKAD